MRKLFLHQVQSVLVSSLIALAVSCGGTRRNGEVCNFEPCAAGLVCNAAHRCVPADSVDGGEDARVAADARDGMTASDGGLDAVGSCTNNDSCPADKPICASGACGACTTNEACAGLSASTPYCETDMGRCVTCLASSDCPVATPACVSGACVKCNAPGASAAACSERGGGKPVCGSAGLCVECGSSGDCSEAGRPICEANACRGCEADAECAAKLGAEPGVCLQAEGGRCAAEADVIYVENANGKCKASGPGTAAMPYCGLAEGMAAAKSGGKPAVVLKGPQGVDRVAYGGPGKLTVVGKSGARIAPGAGIGLDVTSGELTARNLTVRGGDQQGIVVRMSAALNLEQSQVLDNAGGGILVDGGKLVLETTKVSNNGPGSTGPVTWGGMFLNAPASGTRLERVSVTGNKQVGISCSSEVAGAEVFASGNSGGVEIAPTCNITPCSPASPTCGAGD